MMQATTLHDTLIAVGGQIRFTPRFGDHNKWWMVRAVSDRYIVATRQADFEPKGVLFYTVVDIAGVPYQRGDAMPGTPVRSSLDTLGGGFDIGPNGEGCEDVIPLLEAETWQLSRRRMGAVWEVERK